MLPLLAVGGAMAAGGLIGAAASGGFSRGRMPNRSDYEYGYDPKFDFTQANNDYGRQGQSADALSQAGQLARLEAEGKLGPSVAEIQQRQGQQRAMADAAQMAASSRGGPGMMALAQRQAQQQQAQMSVGANDQTAMLRAQERQAALGRAIAADQAAGGIAGQMRQGSQGQVFGVEDRNMQAARYEQEGAMAFDQQSRAVEEAAKQRRMAIFGSMMNFGGGMATKGAMG